MFSLIKIPCILVATVGLHVSTTPPAPPPTEGERVASTTLEALLGLPLAPLILKVYVVHSIYESNKPEILTRHSGWILEHSLR